MQDDDDIIPENFDPFDMLQEHNIMIERLIKAHNAQDRVIQEMARQAAVMSEFIVATNSRIDQLESIVKQ